jgi:hypothetical protein
LPYNSAFIDDYATSRQPRVQQIILCHAHLFRGEYGEHGRQAAEIPVTPLYAINLLQQVHMYNLRHIVSFIYSFNHCQITADINANIPNNAYIEHFDKRKERKAPIKKSEKAPSPFTLASIHNCPITIPKPLRKRPNHPKTSQNHSKNKPKSPQNRPQIIPM